MKVLAVLCVAILCLIALVALLPAHATSANVSGAVLEGGDGALALATPRPTRERFYKSYPAPTGLPGFRIYYQKRCYPGCHYGVDVVTPTTKTETEALPTIKPIRPRYYKSFPARTGLLGFRKYYQKRCYPGCHYGVDVVAPTPKTKTHAVPTPTIKPTQPRYYESYPAPTGLPGFRKYYQKRCYPGCYYGDAVVTPVPGVVHP